MIDIQAQISVAGLKKNYGSQHILDDISFNARAGEILGVFGRSGAGKSVILRLLASAEFPDSGSISSSTPHILLSPQIPSAGEDITPTESLLLYASLYEIPRRKRRTVIKELLGVLAIESNEEGLIKDLPLGVQKLLEIARVLLSPSGILLLDDPMICLDGAMRARLWEYLMKLRTCDQRTVIIATSRREDAELCDRVLMLDRGKVLALGTVEELRRMADPETLVIETLGNSSKESHFGKSGVVVGESDGSLLIEVGSDQTPFDLIDEMRGRIAAIRYCPRNLDTVLDALISRSTE